MEEGLSVGFVRLVRWRFVCHVHIARVHVRISINITFLYQMFLIGSHGKQVEHVKSLDGKTLYLKKKS